MLDCEVVFPIVGQRLIEASVLLFRDLRRVTGPERLGFVELLCFLCRLFDLFGLLRLLFLLFVYLFNLGFLILTLFLLLFLLFLLLFNLFFNLLGYNKLDRIRDELRVLLDDVLDLG